MYTRRARNPSFSEIRITACANVLRKVALVAWIFFGELLNTLADLDRKKATLARWLMHVLNSVY
jgi:hypothetical protein